MSHAGITVEAAPGDGFLNEERITERSHAVVLAPEDVGGNRDVFENRAKIFGGDADQGLAHDGTRSLVVVDADQAIEQASGEGSE